MWTLTGLALAIIASIPIHAQPVSIPATSVALTPPAGFTLSDSFSGLENPETGSSITVTELPPESFAEISELFVSTEAAAAQFARQGISISEVKQVTTPAGSIPLAVGRQSANGIEVV